MLRPVSISALILAGAFTLAQADVYRWVDEQGQPHYSDQWVPGSEVIKTVRTHPPGTDASARTADRKSLTAANNQISAELQQQDNARATQQDLARSREARCRTVKDAYMRAIASRKVYKDEKDGTRTYLSDTDADAYRSVPRRAATNEASLTPTTGRGGGLH